MIVSFHALRGSVAAHGTDSAVAVLRRRQSSQPRAGPTRASSTPSHEALTLRGGQRFSMVGLGRKLFSQARKNEMDVHKAVAGGRRAAVFSTAN
jgi:hypothetical protein